MIIPEILTGIKQTNKCAPIDIKPFEMIAFSEIAGPAREGQVRILVGPAMRRRNYVFHFEWEIENDLRGPAVFTPMHRPFCDSSIVRVHG